MAHRRHIIPPPTVSSNACTFSKNTASQQHQQKTEKTTTVTNNSNMNNDKINFIDKDEQNLSDYWPSLPILPSQHHNQQNASLDEDSDLLQLHQPSVVTAVVDDDDTTTYASHSDRRKRLLTQYFNVSFCLHSFMNEIHIYSFLLPSYLSEIDYSNPHLSFNSVTHVFFTYTRCFPCSIPKLLSSP